MIFYCERCDRCCPNVCCDRCFRFTLDDCREIEAELPEIGTPASYVGTAVVNGHWGDVLVSLTSLRRALELRGQRDCTVLYWGPHPEIARLIENQPFVRHVRTAPVDDHYKTYQWLTWLRSSTRTDVQKLVPGHFPFSRPYVDCAVSSATDTQRKISPRGRWELPRHSEVFAYKFLRNACGEDVSDIVLLHPSSTWSSGHGEHYPHWNEAIRWLLDNTNRRYLLTGLNNVDIRHPRLIDAIGLLPGNCENLALVRLCRKVITTSNSVAIWATCVGRKALVVGNRPVSRHPWTCYRRVIDREPNVFIGSEDQFDDFTNAAERYLAS